MHLLLHLFCASACINWGGRPRAVEYPGFLMQVYPTPTPTPEPVKRDPRAPRPLRFHHLAIASPGSSLTSYRTPRCHRALWRAKGSQSQEISFLFIPIIIHARSDEGDSLTEVQNHPVKHPGGQPQESRQAAIARRPVPFGLVSTNKLARSPSHSPPRTK